MHLGVYNVFIKLGLTWYQEGWISMVQSVHYTSVHPQIKILPVKPIGSF